MKRFRIVRSETPVRRRAEGGGTGEACCPSGTCLGCGKPLTPGHAFCPYCGRSLKSSCPACSKPVEAGWTVCPACGAPIDPGSIRQV
ncbi:MAG: hypothetical protein A2W20_03795 [Candidatus Aminicenantes bacterium RBG_16_66_30]|nr:MAG: hypothetical protein A2W20_03795 [Candidatus Aminicenantes bacterium RBG_16_66_30]